MTQKEKWRLRHVKFSSESKNSYAATANQLSDAALRMQLQEYEVAGHDFFRTRPGSRVYRRACIAEALKRGLIDSAPTI